MYFYIFMYELSKDGKILSFLNDKIYCQEIDNELVCTGLSIIYLIITYDFARLTAEKVAVFTNVN